MTPGTYSLRAEATENRALHSLLRRSITFSRTEGSRHSVDGWRAAYMELGEFVAECARHSLVGPKVFCPALVSDRWRDPLTAGYADFAVMELAGGILLEELVKRLRDLGVAALVQAAAAHMRTSTIVKQCEFDTWYAGEPDVDAMQWVLAQELFIETDVLSVEPTAHEGCPAHLVRHEPVSAYRLILPLEARFEFAAGGSVWEGLQQWNAMMCWLREGLTEALPPWDLAPTRSFEMQTSDALVAWSRGELLRP